jgi:hypothetical protein
MVQRFAGQNGYGFDVEDTGNKDTFILTKKDVKETRSFQPQTTTNTGKRTEVRGKLGYESGNYDPNDDLHQLLDALRKSASISDLMNGDVVTINPRHPDGDRAKAATDRAYNEERYTAREWSIISGGHSLEESEKIKLFDFGKY